MPMNIVAVFPLSPCFDRASRADPRERRTLRERLSRTRCGRRPVMPHEARRHATRPLGAAEVQTGIMGEDRRGPRPQQAIRG